MFNSWSVSRERQMIKEITSNRCEGRNRSNKSYNNVFLVISSSKTYLMKESSSKSQFQLSSYAAGNAFVSAFCVMTDF